MRGKSGIQYKSNVLNWPWNVLKWVAGLVYPLSSAAKREKQLKTAPQAFLLQPGLSSESSPWNKEIFDVSWPQVFQLLCSVQWVLGMLHSYSS